MEALFNVSIPSNHLTSLQSFYDTIQNHVRALSALGNPRESYGPMLTAVILGKLPSDIKMRLASDHHNSEWTVNELLQSILREIRIHEAGQHSGRKPTVPRTSSTTTSSFHTSTHKTSHS